MKKQTITLMAALIVLAMLLSACSSAALKLDGQDNGQSVEVKSGDKITVTLEGNPTTGYSWELSEYDTAVVQAVGEPDYKSDSKMMGSGGVYTFTLEALEPGTSTVKFIYHRSWEEGVEPIEVFEVTLNVK
jgi:inhibitor of cysteine peptidase